MVEINMEIIGIIILILIIWGVISGIRTSIRKKRYEEKIIRDVGPVLEKALSELEVSATDIDFISKKVKELKGFFEENKIILKNENDEVINICPKCGDTLTVRTVNWYGKIFGCPNYPECHYLKKVKDIKEGTFYNLHF
jgi:predicted RNA-binding Zn-ribbon protein involved in translation (DUF1610 family)